MNPNMSNKIDQIMQIFPIWNSAFRATMMMIYFYSGFEFPSQIETHPKVEDFQLSIRSYDSLEFVW